MPTVRHHDGKLTLKNPFGRGTSRDNMWRDAQNKVKAGLGKVSGANPASCAAWSLTMTGVRTVIENAASPDEVPLVEGAVPEGAIYSEAGAMTPLHEEDLYAGAVNLNLGPGDKVYVSEC